MLKRIKKIKAGTFVNVGGGACLSIMFASYLQSAAATHGVGSMQWCCCAFTLTVTIANFAWDLATILKQIYSRPQNY